MTTKELYTILPERNKIKFKDAINEYEDKYVKSENWRYARKTLVAIVVILGVFIFSALLNICDKIRNFNIYAGYISIVILIALFVYYYVFNVLKLFSFNFFYTNVGRYHIEKAKKHNAITRKKIAERMINFHKNIENEGWYDSNYIEKLEIALNNNDDDDLTKNLKKMLDGTVYEKSKSLIANSAVRSGLYSALSPSPTLDTAFVTSINFKLVKDLIFLYGFRPSTPKFVKIFIDIMIKSLATYGLGGKEVGALTARVSSKIIPIEAAGFAVDIGVQAIANGMMTMFVGYATIDYLKKEFRLQEILGKIEVLDDNDEFTETEKKVIDEITKKVPKISNVFKKIDENDFNSNNDNMQSNQQVKLYISTQSMIGKNVKEVINHLINDGFDYKTINLIKEQNFNKGLFNKNGEIKSVFIENKEDVKKGADLLKNSRIDITYYEFR